MATTIENNTEGLQEILRQVNALPSAESGGGGAFEIPVIDLIELGFPEFDEDIITNGWCEYRKVIDENMFRQFKNTLGTSLVKIVVNIYGTVVTFVATCWLCVSGAMEMYRANVANGAGYYEFWVMFDHDYPAEPYTCGFNYVESW